MMQVSLLISLLTCYLLSYLHCYVAVHDEQITHCETVRIVTTLVRVINRAEMYYLSTIYKEIIWYKQHSNKPEHHLQGARRPKLYFLNCSAHRWPTEMSLYSVEKYCPEDSKKYKAISVSGLRAEQFAIKIDQFYREKHPIYFL